MASKSAADALAQPGDTHASPAMGEFIPLMALMMSLAAMSIDSMLPALGVLGRDLGVAHVNDTQLVVSALFLGMAAGQVLIGPLSDGVGRKPALYTALFVFVLGSVLCLLARSFTTMLVGRVLQGVGASGPRIVCMALIRDRYGGRAMARIMSIIMSVFIIVPAVAPAIGQGILLVSHWRAIFGFLLLQAVVGGIWFAVRQPETLPPERRMAISARRIASAVAQTCRHPITLGYTIAAGLAFGALIGYLTSARQIFQDQYGVGERFPLYFAALALALGAAAIMNARLVMRLGMHHLCIRALIVFTGLSVLFAAHAYNLDGSPALWQLMAYMGTAFFCLGVLFGNFNALAMEPMGHIAGTAAAVIGSLTTLISLTAGTLIGRAFDGTVLPLVYGFTALGAVALAVVFTIERRRPSSPQARGSAT